MEHRRRTRLQTEAAKLRLLHLPDGCLEMIMRFAAKGATWEQGCRLAQVCRTFRRLFHLVAFEGRPISLNLDYLSLQLPRGKQLRQCRHLMACLAAVAPSVTHLRLRSLFQHADVKLEDLLEPLAPYVQKLDILDGTLSLSLLRALAAGYRSGRTQGASSRGSGSGSGAAWAALREVAIADSSLWVDVDLEEIEGIELQLNSMPEFTSKIVEFKCNCQGMEEGGMTLFYHLTALRSLELEEFVVWDRELDWDALRNMPHLTRLVLDPVESLDQPVESLRSLTQVRELSLLGCCSTPSSLATLTNLVCLQLELDPDINPEEGEDERAGAAAVWKLPKLRELRWAGGYLDFEAAEGGPPPVDLPSLVDLELEDVYFEHTGLCPELCTITQLTSLRIKGGDCPRFPPAISRLAALQVLAIDSCVLPSMPATITALTAVTNLHLAHTASKHLPTWVLHMPVQKLWVSHNQITGLLPNKIPKMSASAGAALKAEWLGRLTHVCLSANGLKQAPPALLQHGSALQELDLSFNSPLQISSSAADLLSQLDSLRTLRLFKGYWHQGESWTQASRRAIAKLQQKRPDLAAVDTYTPWGQYAW